MAQAGVLGHDAQGDGGHGHLASRKVGRTQALAGWGVCERWPGLTTLVMVESTRQVWDQASGERRDSRSSRPGTTDDEAKRWSGVMRPPGECANRGQGVLDVALGEDTHRTRAGESAQTLALIRTRAVQLLRRETSGPVGIAAKQKRAGWDHNYLLKILAQT